MADSSEQADDGDDPDSEGLIENDLDSIDPGIDLGELAQRREEPGATQSKSIAASATGCWCGWAIWYRRSMR